MSLTPITGYVTKSTLASAGNSALNDIALFDAVSTVIGFGAGDANRIGILNTLVGYLAAGDTGAVSGDGLVAVGTEALFFNRGSFTTAVGARAGYSNVSGSENTLVGYNAGFDAVAASGAVAVGFLAGSAALGDNNVYVGRRAGAEPPTSTDENVGVGHAASAAGGGAVAVGSGASAGGAGSVALGAGASAGGAGSVAVGAGVSVAGAGSLVILPAPAGESYASTADGELNVFGVLLGSRGAGGAVSASLRGDALSLQGGGSRLDVGVGGVSIVGTARVDKLTTGDLYVDGTITASQAIEAGAAAVDDLDAGRAGVGELEVLGAASFGGAFAVSNAGGATAWVAGDLAVGGQFDVVAGASFGGAFAVSNAGGATAWIAGDLEVGGQLDVVAGASFGGAFAVSNAGGATARIAGDLAVGGQLTVAGASFEGASFDEFTVSNADGATARIAGDLAVGGHLDAADAYFETLTVASSTALAGPFALANAGLVARVDGGLGVGEGLSAATAAVAGDLSVGGNATVGSNLVFINPIDPARISRWQVGLENPYPESEPQVADLVLRSSDSTVVRFTQDFVPSVLNFTGSHTVAHELSDREVGASVGMLVVATGRYADLDGRGDGVTVDEAVPVVDLSRRARDSRVFGVIASAADSPGGAHHAFRLGNLEFRRARRPGDKAARVRVNSSGEGALLVCGEGGDLLNGDLLCSSALPGVAMSQGDDVVRACTVAKVTQDVAFGGDPASTRLVGCVYLC